MTEVNNPKPDSKINNDQASLYQIRVKGHLDRQWSDWFEGMAITPEKDGTTLLTGPVIDDAALHGLLKKVRDSGLRLLSVNQSETNPANEADREQSDDALSEQYDKEGTT